MAEHLGAKGPGQQLTAQAQPQVRAPGAHPVANPIDFASDVAVIDGALHPAVNHRQLVTLIRVRQRPPFGGTAVVELETPREQRPGDSIVLHPAHVPEHQNTAVFALTSHEETSITP